ncbi:uncharacterized protein HMPREF1541_08006 [Cyphellophora europaea CBS 101466]|uniref:NmrA-like domain-containing protein n=1 Tax=Cyphellophora europaea (strain CBS 101466) TaxID=1220924 RepID=W2RMU2_CYPE1|nr:uncharacterized protein HMPREF1541_08006 [Cyphellophora europaea CBS 101466]ETN37018.1 hypothetical protein HMPREF1541_08006 [Cyphellophora europaea CBS 101466]
MFGNNKCKVAIVGAGGRLGKHILSALLSPEFRSSYADVVVLRRSGTESAVIPNATVRTFEQDTIGDCIHDVDVLISAVGPTGHAFKDSLVNAMAKSSVRLYIPSEFGVDHTVHDFPHAEWDHKKLHFDLTQKFIPNVQVLRIYVGLFLEESIGPWFGFHTAADKYDCIGSADTPVSYTSLDDAGKVVAQVARMQMLPILEQIHIGGDTKSTRETAHIMQEAGAGKVKINELDLEKWKKATIEEGTADPSKYLRFLMGEGRINHTQEGLGNDNEIVNPGQTLWKWKTMMDYAQETKGKPWAEFKWDESVVS